MSTQMLRCVDCNAEFEFTEREQAFYHEKGWSAPRRCKTCRHKRKPQTPHAPPGEDDDTTIILAPSKFKVNCSTCGIETMVPFKPDPTRPVYCRSCLAKHRK
ncbi:MAG TPA: CxxC-x17-CxxC domain-containing protein [Planctomycetota bacterium]|nr:CxxC-x17-CxxC domain-containing protein [Planctomycetota bacterium]